MNRGIMLLPAMIMTSCITKTEIIYRDKPIVSGILDNRCLACEKPATRDFHGSLQYRYMNENVVSRCLVWGCKMPYLPYCDDHEPKEKGK